MRSRKELIYLNIKDLTAEEINELANYDLNCCDKCGEIDLSTELLWLDGEDFYSDEVGILLLKKRFTAVCKDCYNAKAAEVNLINRVIDLRKNWDSLKKNTYPLGEHGKTDNKKDFKGVFKIFGNRIENIEQLISEVEKVLPEK